MEFDFARQRRASPAVRQVKTWAEEALHLPDGYAVLVTELRCSEEGCPPVETIIAIVGGPEKQRQGKLPCPADQVSRSHVEAVCAALLLGAAGACDDAEVGFTD